MKRVVKPKSKIIISVYSEIALKERLEEYKRLKIPIKKIENNGKVIFSFDGDNISEQFSKRDITEIFSKENLELERFKECGIGNIYLFKLKGGTSN